MALEGSQLRMVPMDESPSKSRKHTAIVIRGTIPWCVTDVYRHVIYTGCFTEIFRELILYN